jgi:hypothetical protein
MYRYMNTHHILVQFLCMYVQIYKEEGEKLLSSTQTLLLISLQHHTSHLTTCVVQYDYVFYYMISTNLVYMKHFLCPELFAAEDEQQRRRAAWMDLGPAAKEGFPASPRLVTCLHGVGLGHLIRPAPAPSEAVRSAAADAI